MAVQVPITVEGNLTGDPELGETEAGKPFARFSVAVNDRRYDEEAKQWENTGDPVFHRATVFGRQAENVAASLRKGDTVIVSGALQFQSWEDVEGNKHTGTQILAHQVGPSLRFNQATLHRTGPKVDGPDASATGPLITAGAPTVGGLER